MKTWKRVLSLFMVVLMLTSMMPVSVLAADGEEPTPAAEHAHSHGAVVTAPTCAADGFTTYTCECGDSYVADPVAATGHSWGEWSEAEGIKTRACAACGAAEQEAVQPEPVPEVDEAVAAVQAMIDALPAAVADEAAAAALKAQIDAVDAAIAALTAEQQAQLNTLPLEAARVAYTLWVEQSAADKQPETDPVAEIQAKIDALNPVVTTEAERDAIWAAMDVIDPAIEALTAEQQAKLNMANYNAAIDAAAAFANPEFDDIAAYANHTIEVTGAGAAASEVYDVLSEKLAYMSSRIDFLYLGATVYGYKLNNSIDITKDSTGATIIPVGTYSVYYRNKGADWSDSGFVLEIAKKANMDMVLKTDSDGVYDVDYNFGYGAASSEQKLKQHVFEAVIDAANSKAGLTYNDIDIQIEVDLPLVGVTYTSLWGDYGQAAALVFGDQGDGKQEAIKLVYGEESHYITLTLNESRDPLDPSAIGLSKTRFGLDTFTVDAAKAAVAEAVTVTLDGAAKSVGNVTVGLDATGFGTGYTVTVSIGKTNDYLASEIAASFTGIEFYVNEYTLTWNANGGKWDDETTTKTTTQPYGAAIAAPAAAPEKEQSVSTVYTFAGWDGADEDSAADAALGNVGGAATYTAVWAESAREYEITWKIGETTETTKVAYGTAPTHADPATGEDISFDGWKDEYGTVYKEALPAVSGPAAYTAVFTNDTVYTIVFKADAADETALSTQRINVSKNPEATIVAPAEPTKAGYVFDGWSPELVGTVPTKSETIVAVWASDKNANGVADRDETATVTTTVIAGEGSIALSGSEKTIVDGTTVIFDSAAEGGNVLTVTATPADSGSSAIRNELKSVSHSSLTLVNGGIYAVTAEFTQDKLELNSGAKVYVNKNALSDRITGLKEKVLNVAVVNYTGNPADYKVVVDATFNYDLDDLNVLGQTGLATALLGESTKFVITYDGLTASTDIALADSRQVLAIEVSADVNISAENEPADVLQQVKNVVRITATDPQTGAVTVLGNSDSYFDLGDYVWPEDDLSDEFEVAVKVPGGNATYQNTANATVKLSCTDTTPVYTVIYNVDGVEEKFERLLAGAEMPTVADPAKEYYTFAGWSPAVTDTVVAPAVGKTITFTATWTINNDNNGNTIPDETETYTVIYTDGVAGEEIFADQKTEDCVWGTVTPAAPEVPTREGWNFKGWTPEWKAIVAAPAEGNTITYTATWSQYFVVSFEDRGEPYSLPQEIAPSGTATQPGDPVWAEGDEDHDFLGWYYGDVMYNFATPVIDNVKLTAKWRDDFNRNDIDDAIEARFTVIYMDGETELGKFENVLIGLETPAIEEPTKENYKFNGWAPEVSETVTGNITYVAQWLDDVNNNGVSDALETVTITVTKADEADAISVTGAQQQGESDQWVFDSKTVTEITVTASPVVSSGKSVSYVESITVDGVAETLSYNNYKTAVTVPVAESEESKTVAVSFKAAAFDYKDERILSYNDSMETVADKDVYEAMVNGPAYEGADVTIKYKAREATTRTVMVANLDLPDMVKDFLVNTLNWTSFDVPLTELWLDVNETVEDTQSLEKVIEQRLTWDNIKNNLFNLDGLLAEIGASAKYDGTHAFGYNATPDNTVDELIRITYKSGAMSIEEENTITLQDMRTPTTLQGNNVSLIYRDYTDESLVEAIAPTVVGTDGVTLSGAEIICLDITDPYTYEGQNVSETAYELKMKFAGNSEYKPSEATFSVTVTKADLSMDLPDVIATYGQPYSTAPNYTFGNAYPMAKEVDDSLIKFVVGLDVANIAVDQDGVTGINGTVQLFLNAELQGMLDTIAGLGGSDNLELNISDLLKYLLPAGEGTTDAISGIFDELAGLTQLGELKVKIGGSMPTETGVYLYGAVSTNSNYETAYDVAYLVIQPDAQRVWLDFNYNDSNGIFTPELLSHVDLGASAYNDEALTERNDLASTKINNLFLGVDKNGEFIARLYSENMDPEIIEAELGHGAYTQLAYIAEFANQMHYAVPVIRAFAILPNTLTVDIVDNEGTEFKRTFDNAPQELDVEVVYTAGTAIVPDEQYLTVSYKGIQTNGKVYDSETAPTHAGIYLVTASYVQRDEKGDILAVGADVETLTILPAETETVVEDRIANVGTQTNLRDLITVYSDSGANMDTTVISAKIASDGSFSEIGWDAIEGNVNVDFPRWIDELLAEHMPSVTDGLTAAELSALIDNRLPQLLGWLGENTTPELVRSATNAFANLNELLAQIPASATLTFDSADSIHTAGVGAYLVAAVVTDSDHWASADSGLLVVVPVVEQVWLKWNYQDANGIWTRELLQHVDLLATAYEDESYTTIDDKATAKISYKFISVNENGELVVFENADELDNGVYTELAFIEFKVDGKMVLSDLIARPLIIAPNTADVVFVDENGNVNADRLFTYDKLPHAMNAEVRVNGTAIEPDEGELIVTYVGLRSNGEVYNSTVAPSRAGVYTVVASYADYENGFLMRSGAAAGAMVIQPAESTISVTGGKFPYNGEGRGVTVEAPTPDVTLISGIAGVTGDFSEVGLDAVVAEMNIDFPAWLDKHLSVQFADAYANGVDSDDVIFKLNQHKEKLLALGLHEELLGKLTAVLEKIPTGVKVTFYDGVTYSEPGVYPWLGIVTDSDYLPSYDTGLLVIQKEPMVLDMMSTKLTYNGEGRFINVYNPSNSDYITIIVDRKNNIGNLILEPDSDALLKALAEALGREVPASIDVAQLHAAVESLISDVENLEQIPEDVKPVLSQIRAALKQLPQSGTVYINGEWLPSDVGEYEFYGASYSAHYATNLTEGILTIEPAQVVVTMDAVSKVVGTTPDPELTWTVKYLDREGNEIEGISTTVTVSASREAGEEVGEYAITATASVSDSNYEVVEVEGGIFTIVKDSVTISTTGSTVPNDFVDGLSEEEILDALGASAENSKGEDLSDAITVTVKDADGNEVAPADMKVGESYTATITYPGDENNKPVSTELTITVTDERNDVTIEATEDTVPYDFVDGLSIEEILEALGVTVKNSEGEDLSDDITVTVYDENGNEVTDLSTLEAGETYTIEVSYPGDESNKPASKEIGFTVTDERSDVTISMKENAEITIGDAPLTLDDIKTALEISAKDAAGNDVPYTVVITDKNGNKVKPENMKAGETYTVTVSAGDGVNSKPVEKTASISTKAANVPATKVTIGPAPKTLVVGDSFQLTITVEPEGCTDKPVWSSSDTSIATVDENGKVTAIKTGEVTITVTVGGASATVTFKVIPDRTGFYPIDLSGNNLGVGPGSVVEVDGASYQLDENSIVWVKETTHKIVVSYKYAESTSTIEPKYEGGKGPHYVYPTNMYVWSLTFTEGENGEMGKYTAERIQELDNFLTYKGTSIRMTGNQGIRIFTAVNSAKRNSLIQGSLIGDSALEGYKLVEYGTLFQWLETGSDLTYDPNRNNRSVAYSAKTGYDAIFSRQGSDIWFTGMLVNLQLDRCDDELILRPYMILEKDGEQVVIHGGTLQRTIGYVALQNRDYKPNAAAANFIWNIIYAVYGKDFKYPA